MTFGKKRCIRAHSGFESQIKVAHVHNIDVSEKNDCNRAQKWIRISDSSCTRNKNSCDCRIVPLRWIRISDSSCTVVHNIRTYPKTAINTAVASIRITIIWFAILSRF
ncbi:hypothetical protein CEXT_90871 [Caerostris extrusa]|uniref:Uncharacterized protein n=1 Tax=Caerostris extrusa TaxID=172846 RepID=A0AAV4S5J6_CAEEX|nr:hypothetical protein CEXT_90871 [Caerostris extrusa]